MSIIKYGIVSSITTCLGIGIYNHIIANKLENKLQEKVSPSELKKIKDQTSIFPPHEKIITYQRALDSLEMKEKIFKYETYKAELDKFYKQGKDAGMIQGNTIGIKTGEYLGFANGFNSGVHIGKGIANDSSAHEANYNLRLERYSARNFIAKHLKVYEDSFNITYYNDNTCKLTTKYLPKYKTKKEFLNAVNNLKK